MKTALIIVDVQRDFCPGGALAIEHGDHIVKPANRLIHWFEERGLPIYFTRDWHPDDHCSFEANGGIWPSHCVAGTEGADFHPELYQPHQLVVVSKATTAEKDAYSGFEGTDLNELLKSQDVDRVLIAGLATDYCVKKTALDAHKLGYHTTVATDAIRAVEAEPEDGRRAIAAMQVRGVEFMDVDAILQQFPSQ